ncbi:MAG: hypothetical protein J6W81_05260, partial [Lentisphaeria bacterium]|nr:hypothetical protein [Lentisphaeria bacterium]
MAIHEEKAPSQWMTILLLIVAFFLIYPLWKLGLRELFWDEGEYAVIVSEMTKFPPDSRLHGMIVPFFFPLFPLLAKGLTLLGLDIEFSLRLLSLLPLAALTVIVGIVTTRMSGINAGAAAAAVMFTTILSAEKVIEGFPQMLTILLIYSAWLLWFYYGQFGGAWNTAWLLVGLFAGLAFYAGGWTALVYLFVPMMFLKRPFTLWRRLNMPGFFGGMAILLFFILLWLIPRWSPQQEIGFFADKSFPEYLKECAYTGVDILLRLMPWTFFLYAPFCPALIVIDKNPLFSKYLKVLFLIAGLILVINPFSKARDILYILPAFAILTGLNYDIVVRRHGDNLCKLLKLWAVGTLLFNIICDLYEILPIEVLKMLLAKLPLLSQHIAEEELLIAKMPYAQSLVISEICLAMLLTVIALFLAFRKNKIWL